MKFRFVSLKSVLLATWVFFVFAIVLLDWRDATLLHYAINVVGFAGLVSALIWQMASKGRWKYVCLSMSAILLLLAVVRWCILIYDILSAIPGIGIGSVMYSLVRSWGALFTLNSEMFGFAWAALAIYWDPAMALLQLLAIVFLIHRDRRKPGG